MKINVDESILKILKFINNSGYEAYLVGGYVRDKLLNCNSNDYDICTNIPFEILTNNFNNFKMMKENDRRNIGCLRYDDKEFEFIAFKGDTLIDDLKKRDITINAIACDGNCKIIDPLNGVSDIQNKNISLVDKSGNGIDFDPLRILRILRFSSIYGFSIDDNTKRIINEKKFLLNNVASERIFEEFKKIITTPGATNVIKEYADIFCVIIPEIKEMRGFIQNNPYHIYDVLEHTLKVMDNVPIDNLELRLAALFHDMGKPFVYSEDDNGMGHFYGHPSVSEKIFCDFCKKYKVDNKMRDNVSRLIRFHEREIPLNKKSAHRFLISYGDENVKQLFTLKKADILGQNPIYDSRLLALDETEKYLEMLVMEEPVFSVRDLAINGNDLMKIGIYGKDIGVTLNQILDKVISGDIDNNYDSISKYLSNFINIGNKKLK